MEIILGYLPYFVLVVIIVLLARAIVKYRKRDKEIKETITEAGARKEADKKALNRLMGWIIGTTIIGGILFAFATMISVNANSCIDKPIIYLYPETEQEVLLELGYKDKITVSYPKYEKGWRVLAQPNGDLLDLDTNKNLYALYYESKNGYDFKVEEDGFVVKGEDTASFLEEKLKILGLNYKEAEEFIVYWLPKLEKNNYNYIRFASPEELEKNMPLNITPAPDTRIRILMTYKGLKTPIKVQEQTLKPMERSGFTAVEWGGTEID